MEGPQVPRLGGPTALQMDASIVISNLLHEVNIALLDYQLDARGIL